MADHSWPGGEYQPLTPSATKWKSVPTPPSLDGAYVGEDWTTLIALMREADSGLAYATTCRRCGTSVIADSMSFYVVNSKGENLWTAHEHACHSWDEPIFASEVAT